MLRWPMVKTYLVLIKKKCKMSAIVAGVPNPVRMAGTGVAKKMVETVKPKRTTFSEILLGESRVMCR